MTETQSLEALVQDIIQNCKFRAPSLIITVLGDSIAPHGGTFWMGSLIELMAPLGINERLVRTATFRLTKEEWLLSAQIGRRSYYRLSLTSVKNFAEAFRRVYAIPEKPWNGQWSLVFLNSFDMTQEARDRVRSELIWSGFGTVSPNVFAHPTLASALVREKLVRLKVANKAVLLRATVDALNEESSTREFIRKLWDIDKLSADYTGFADRFQPLWQRLESQPTPPGDLCFLIRTLVIHEYRRITLRDPQLPSELLTADWAGLAARELCRNLYRKVHAGAEAYLVAHVETADGPLPTAESDYYSRFGGLD